MIALIAATVVTFKTSPWPGALLIRPLFEADARNVKKRMAGFAPTGIASILNETYRPGDRDAKLDIYWPSSANTDSAFPTIFWLHGGAWISGHRNDASAFLQLIAAQGFTVISVGFSNSPRKMYPTALFQINDAVAYVQQHADRLHVNPHMFAFAGDSSGAQLGSQLVTMATNPQHAGKIGIVPSVGADQIRAVALFCGLYDMEAFAGSGSTGLIEGDQWMFPLIRWGAETVLWAYTGARKGDLDILRSMSSIDAVTSSFPATFISGGNADPLTDSQSRAFAAKLETLGVRVETLYFPPDHAAQLGHEYQFRLELPDAKRAITEMTAFLRRELSPPVESPSS